MERLFISTLLLFWTSAMSLAQYPMSDQTEKRISDLISKMTLQEKMPTSRVASISTVSTPVVLETQRRLSCSDSGSLQKIGFDFMI